MTNTKNGDPHKLLDDTADSIRKLILDIDNRELEGKPITATEIQTIARRLQGHVDNLLAASRSLPAEKPKL